MDLNRDDKDEQLSIKAVDMTEDMINFAIDTAKKALSKYSIEKDIAQFIKITFDNTFSKYWHCLVGKQFGSYVTHDSKHYIYFYLGEMSFLLYKFG